MIESLIADISLGADGFVVCAAIGLLGIWIPRPLPFAAWFGVCDGLGLLAGHAVGLSPAWLAAGVPAVAVLGTALALLLIVLRVRQLLFLLPVLLSFDNFVAGAAGVPEALPLGIVLSCLASATLALAGLLTGRVLAAHMPHPRLAGGALLLGLGLISAAV